MGEIVGQTNGYRHLHDGLVTVAKREGVNIMIDSKVESIDHKDAAQVKVKTEKGKTYSFDLVIGSDGINSVCRRTILPQIKPSPPTTNCAYRAIVPYETIRKDPIARELIEKKTMEVWMGRKRGKEYGYVISYPISNGKDFNMVLSHHRDAPVDTVQEDEMSHVRETYKDFDPRLKRIIDMIPDGKIKRWPLLVTRCPTWSSPQKNIVLMVGALSAARTIANISQGDAAHSMASG